METDPQEPIAVSFAELRQFGCPHCGYRSGFTPVSSGDSALWTCASEECGRTSVYVAQGITKSGIGFGEFYPTVQPHPRMGIPSHGRPDKKPESGGEFFRSRGIGMDNCSCFICGTHDRDGKDHIMLHNIAAFVECREAGERVVGMFQQDVRLDYRDHKPDHVQVKVGACDRHHENLLKLYALVTQDHIITADRISEAMA